MHPSADPNARHQPACKIIFRKFIVKTLLIRFDGYRQHTSLSPTSIYLYTSSLTRWWNKSYALIQTVLTVKNCLAFCFNGIPIDAGYPRVRHVQKAVGPRSIDSNLLFGLSAPDLTDINRDKAAIDMNGDSWNSQPPKPISVLGAIDESSEFKTSRVACLRRARFGPARLTESRSFAISSAGEIESDSIFDRQLTYLSGIRG